MSSIFEATFHPRAAKPGEVTLLISNIFNHSETLPVHVKKEDLFHLYLSLFGDPQQKIAEQEGQQQAHMCSDPTLGRADSNIHAEW